MSKGQCQEATPACSTGFRGFFVRIPGHHPDAACFHTNLPDRGKKKLLPVLSKFSWNSSTDQLCVSATSLDLLPSKQEVSSATPHLSVPALLLTPKPPTYLRSAGTPSNSCSAPEILTDPSGTCNKKESHQNKLFLCSSLGLLHFPLSCLLHRCTSLAFIIKRMLLNTGWKCRNTTLFTLYSHIWIKCHSQFVLMSCEDFGTNSHLHDRSYCCILQN